MVHENPWAASYHLQTIDGRDIWPTGAKRLKIPPGEVWLDPEYVPFKDYIMFHEMAEARYIAMGMPEHQAHHKAEQDELSRFCADPTWQSMIQKLGKGHLVDASRKCSIGGAKSGEFDIVLTAPHAACPVNRGEHACDEIAASVANRLFDEFVRRGKTVSVAVGVVPRTELDLNRDEGMKNEFFQSFISDISPGVIHLDIHSFPPDMERLKDYDVVLFRSPGDATLAEKLAEELKKQGLRTAVMYGTSDNTLVRESRNRGARSVLVEFNERWQNKEKDIANRVAQTVIGLSTTYI